jgi:hypothetical protein
MGRPRNQPQSKSRKKRGIVKSNVVWVSEQGKYREVLDDSGPDLKLGDVVHSVIKDEKTGEGHFEYGEGDA